MTFIRSKRSKGIHTYYQLVENKYVEGKVKQKVVKHLGSFENANTFAKANGMKMPEGNEKQVKWRRIWSRRYSVQKLCITATCPENAFKEKLGKGFNHALFVSEGVSRTLYVDKGEWDEIGRRVVQACENEDEWRVIYKETIKHSKSYEEFGLKLNKTDLKTIDNRQLAKTYEGFIALHTGDFEFYLWLPFFVDEYVIPKLQESLEQELGGKAREVLLAIVSPEEVNAITRENLAFLELLVKVKEESLDEVQVIELLKQHAQQFGFLAVYDFDESPWNTRHFEAQLKEYTYKSADELRRKITSIKNNYAKNKEHFKKAIGKIHNHKLKNLAHTAHVFAFLKDARDDYRRHGNFLIQPLYAEIARRAGLSQQEVVSLTVKEITSFLKTRHLDRAVIRDRLNGVTVLMQYNKVAVYSGLAAKQVAQKELPIKPLEKIDAVKGIPASRGVARGPARIIRHKLLLDKVQTGDVIVAVTTMPDYVPAMKKAVAIVTNEGGLTCHAAIVCRELGIPCVVGTKNATLAFTDGELIEVDATKGTVKKIKPR